MKKTERYSMNKIDGFNPYDFVENALDSTGAQIISVKTGKPLQYISTAAKIFWFRMKYPEGAIIVTGGSEEKDGHTVVCYAAEIKTAPEKEPIARWEHSITVYDILDLDQMASKCQTIATGKALSKAGFGCEVELALDMVTEGEVPEKGPVAPVPKTETKAPIGEEKLETDDILALIEEEIEKEETEEEPEADPLDAIIRVSENATAHLIQFDGLTFREAIAKNAKIAESIAKNARVQASFTEETIEAAKKIK